MEKRRSATSAASVAPPPSFQSQYDALLDAYYSVDGVDESRRVQRMLELQSSMAQLSFHHGELRRALEHYEKILSLVDTHTTSEQPSGEGAGTPEGSSTEDVGGKLSEISEEMRKALPELRVTALTNIATCHHRLGDAREAMRCLLIAKKEFRELKDKPQEPPTKTLEMTLAANYAVMLQAQRSVDECVVAAEAALDLAGDMPGNDVKAPANPEDSVVQTVRLMATGVLASTLRAKGDVPRAREQCTLAVRLLDRTKDGDPLLLARSHNNAGVAFAESGDFASALSRYLKAYQINMTSNVPDVKLQATLVYQIGRMLAELQTTVAVPGDSDTKQLDAHQWLLRIDQQAQHGILLSIVTQVCLGELAFYAGEYTDAEAKLTDALEKLKTAVEADQAASKKPTLSKQEIVKIQGAIDSLLGNTLLVQGKLAAAEEAHQRDLELALDCEDIHAQLRGLRNLAVLYDVSKRFDEAITLWRETIEIAAVLNSKRDLLIGYGGLGDSLIHLSIADFGKDEFQEFLSQRENQPRTIFVKQRALAIELADLEGHVRAQKSIVGTYEWRPQDSELEQRLEECDALVRVCERQDNLSHRSDAYRCLANALTVQIKRLAERGQRFAEAIKVLTFRRNAILQKFRDAAMNAVLHEKPSKWPFDRVDVVSGASLGY